LCLRPKKNCRIEPGIKIVYKGSSPIFVIPCVRLDLKHENLRTSGS
jgi:hypothetical protein